MFHALFHDWAAKPNGLFDEIGNFICAKWVPCRPVKGLRFLKKGPQRIREKRFPQKWDLLNSQGKGQDSLRGLHPAPDPGYPRGYRPQRPCSTLYATLCLPTHAHPYMHAIVQHSAIGELLVRVTTST